jgi:hypothetical protein
MFENQWEENACHSVVTRVSSQQVLVPAEVFKENAIVVFNTSTSVLSMTYSEHLFFCVPLFLSHNGAVPLERVRAQIPP